jgi:hypothetical protein
MQTQNDFQEWLNGYMKRHKLSPSKLSEITGINRQNFSRWSKGDNRPRDPKHMKSRIRKARREYEPKSIVPPEPIEPPTEVKVFDPMIGSIELKTFPTGVFASVLFIGVLCFLIIQLLADHF